MAKTSKRARSEETDAEEVPTLPINETPTLVLAAEELEREEEDGQAVKKSKTEESSSEEAEKENGDEQKNIDDENDHEHLNTRVEMKKKEEFQLYYGDGIPYSCREILVLTLIPVNDDEIVERYIFDYHKLMETGAHFRFTDSAKAKELKMLTPNAVRDCNWCNLACVLTAMQKGEFLVTTGLTLPDEDDEPEWAELMDETREKGYTPNMLHAHTAFFQKKARELEFPSKDFKETEADSLFRRAQSRWYDCLITAYPLKEDYLPVFNYDKLKWKLCKDITVMNQYCANSMDELRLQSMYPNGF